MERENQPSEMTQEQFLKGYDFMRIGQAVNRGQWQSAAMIQRRMEQNAKKLGLDTMVRAFGGLRQAIIHKNKTEAKQILAVIVAKRVHMLNQMSEK